MGAPGAIETEKYTDRIAETLSKHGLSLDNIEFVEELPGGQPWAITMCYKIRKLILLKQTITEDDRRLAVAALEEKFPEEVKLVEEDDWNLVKLFVLFEVCHIIYRYKPDHECFLWAFYELRQ